MLIGALIVDFLAIHPVADGNGRLARLLTTYELLSQGYGVARYVSIEQRIFESKHTYYDRLRRHILEQARVVFRRREVERSLPEVSPATIRLVLNALRDDGDIVPEGAGPRARWRRVDRTTGQ